MNKKYFWNRLLGNILVAFIIYGLVSAVNADKASPDSVLFAMKGVFITSGIWISKIIWE